jgi:hypothetical protein
MVLPSLSPMANRTRFTTVENGDPFIMFGIPSIIIILIGIPVILILLYRHYNKKHHILPHFEPVVVRTSPHAEGDGAT